MIACAQWMCPVPAFPPARPKGAPMRRSVPAALAAGALASPVLLIGAAPAHAAAVFVETNPSTVPAGDEVGLRASCDDNLTAGRVTVAPIGTVEVSPRYGFLTA